MSRTHVNRSWHIFELVISLPHAEKRKKGKESVCLLKIPWPYSGACCHNGFCHWICRLVRPFIQNYFSNCLHKVPNGDLVSLPVVLYMLFDLIFFRIRISLPWITTHAQMPLIIQAGWPWPLLLRVGRVYVSKRVGLSIFQGYSTANQSSYTWSSVHPSTLPFNYLFLGLDGWNLQTYYRF